MKASVRSSIPLYLSYAFGILCIFVLYSVVSQAHLESHIINSDTLYLPSIYLDIFENGNSFSDWSINAAPNFFPDMFLFMGINFVTGNFLLSIVLFSTLQYLIVVMLLHSILSAFWAIETRNIIMVGNALLLFLPLSALLQNNFEFAFQFITNAYHLGPFVNALLVLWMIKCYWQKSHIAFVFGIVIFTALAFSSDMLFIVYCSVPLVGAVIINSLFERKIPNKKTFLILTWHILGFVCGHLLTRGIISFTDLRFAGSKTGITLQGIIDSWAMFTNQYGNYLSAFSLFGLFIIVLLVSILISVIQVFRAQKNDRFVFIFTSIFLIIGLLTPVIMGVYFGYDTIRYNYAVYLLSPFVIAISIRKHVKLLRYSALGLYLLLFGTLLLHTNDDSNGIWNYVPKRVVEFDDLDKKYNLHRGIAPYWDAKLITMFSNQDVFILNAFDELTPYEHVSNRTWWRTDPVSDESMVFDFVIIGSAQNKENAIALLGEPSLIIQENGFEILKYPAFTYPEESYEPRLLIE